MIFCVGSNLSHMTEPKSFSHAVGYFFLGSIPSKCVQERLNGPVHVNLFLNFVAASEAEAETWGCFVTGRYVIIIQNTLE